MMVRRRTGLLKPTFMIIGAQKAGTSSLYQYLSQHPDIISSQPKELHYFDTLHPTSGKIYDKYYPYGFFSKKITFEATPRYLYFPGTAKRLFDYNKKLKFIVILRDPVDRAYSAWNMYREMKASQVQIDFFKSLEHRSSSEQLWSVLYKNDFPTFEELVAWELSNCEGMLEPSILRRGYYRNQIEAYLKLFRYDQFLFLDFNDLKYQIELVFDKIARFIDVKGFDLKRIDLAPKNKREYVQDMDSKLRQDLSQHFKQENKGLENLIGTKYNWM
jgi:hypothetical protein